MAGLRGDDESDLEADAEELLDSRATLIEVADVVADGATGAAASNGAGAAGAAAGDGAAGAVAGDGAAPGASNPTAVAINTGKRKRNATSKAWLDFEKLFSVINGKKVRTGAKCNHCGHEYASRSAIGTDHLLRHLKVCEKRKENTHLSQSLLSFSSDGSVRHWEFSAERARTGLCRLIARTDLALCIGAHPIFEEHIRDFHNPRFTHVSAQTTARDLIKYHNGLRGNLIASFAGVTSVSLTSDIWSGNAKEDYLSVVSLC
jgi:hypothetical protein